MQQQGHETSRTLDDLPPIIHDGSSSTAGPAGVGYFDPDQVEEAEPLEIPVLSFEFESLLTNGPNIWNTPPRIDKRDHHSAFEALEHDLPAWVGNIFPSFLPSIPPALPLINLENPCLDATGQPFIHPFLRPGVFPRVVREDKEFNSWIKVRFLNSEWGDNLQPSVQNSVPLRHLPSNHAKRSKETPRPREESDKSENPIRPTTSYLPKHFGSIVLRTNIDRQLYSFYIAAFCSGRTVIPNDNPVRHEIAPIAATNELVKHSLLALTASYFLDFQKGSVIAQTARAHHNRAVAILDQELRSLEWGVPGKEEAITAGLLLIILNEIINWEGTSGQRHPVWYRCGEVVRRILDKSDPGIKYRAPWNVQTSRARPQLAAMYVMHNVFSDCFYPLDLSAKRCPTPWLLQGSDLEQRQINGSIGASPRLMHYFAKITFLATKLYNDPKARTTLKVAKALDTALDNIQQWSEISLYSYPQASDIFDKCKVDDDGFVETASEVLDLVAFVHVIAAKIYLHCRVFRRPARYPPVQEWCDQIFRAVRMMPVSGHLLSAIWPLFPFFIAGIVSVQEKHKEFIRSIYASFCTIARGNLTPTWTAMQHIWEWMDENHTNEWLENEDVEWEVANADPWWEDMAEDMVEHCGRVNVA